MRRWGSIQALRAIAAWLVVVGHVLASPHSAFPRPDLLTFIIENITTPLCLAGVDLFFVISGAIMLIVTRNTPSQVVNATGFAARRAARIYPLFWVVMTVNLCILEWRDVADLGTSWLEMALIDVPPSLPIAWTLGYEIRFYLLVALGLLLPIRPAFRFATIGGVILIGTYAGAFGPLMIEFLFGLIVGEIATRTARLGLFSLLAGCVLLALSIAYVYPGSTALDVLGFRTWAFGFPAALILYGAMATERSRRIHVPSWLVAAGDASYSTYLWHVPVISLFLGFWPRGDMNWLWPLYAAIFATVAVVSWLSWTLIEQPVISAARPRSLML